MMTKAGFVFVTLFIGIIVSAIPPTLQQEVNSQSHVESTRIVGGSVAADNSAPYMVAISSGWIFRSLVCGGSLISDRHVLTAAHCVEALYSFGFLRRSSRVTVGTSRWNRGGQVYSVARNITHQNYQSSIVKNDIGVLVTKTKVKLTQNVEPISLRFEFVDAGVQAKATGWGRTRFMGPISNNLLELKVQTIDGQQCVKEVANTGAELGLETPPVDPQIELCTFHSAVEGMCNGDSGSPLVQLDNGQQIGVVSWGLPCARGAPDIFVRISAFQDWLQENIKE